MAETKKKEKNKEDLKITEELLRRHEVRANKLSMRLMLVFTATIIIVYGLTFAGVFVRDIRLILGFLIINLVVTTICFVWAQICNYAKPSVKYVLITGLVVYTVAFYAWANYSITPFVVLPILLTCIYCSPSFSIYGSLITAAGFTISTFITSMVADPDLNMVYVLPGTTLTIAEDGELLNAVKAAGFDRTALLINNLLYTWLPMMLTIVIVLILTYTFARLFRKMLAEQDSISRVNATLKADLSTASSIQSGALPTGYPAYPEHQNVVIYASMNAAKQVGGDFYDFFEINEDHVCFLIADVSGKGIPAALFMMQVKTMIKNYAMINADPAWVFTQTNKALCKNNPENMFATAWIGILNTRSGILSYTNAGHNWPLLAHQNDSFTFLKQRHGFLLAGMDDTVYRKSEIQLEDGDSLFFYTDGVSEAHNENDELYGEDRIREFLNAASNRSGNILLPLIKESVDAFAGNRDQFDDITMMMVNYHSE